VVGVLARTGTPVDRTVHVSLGAIEAIHLEWQGGTPIPGFRSPHNTFGSSTSRQRRLPQR
jgi:putative ABC transport system permease protein